MGGGARNFGGTSASSPYAAGVAALLFELAPGLTPSQLRAHLMGAGVSVTNPDNALSFPRIDVEGSVSTALPDCGDNVLDPGESCDDGNTITGDCCSAICTFEAMGSSCSDATVCTTGDQCDGVGICTGTALMCDDSNGCTDDTCDPVGGCEFPPNSAACDDGDACTSGDICSAGSCSSGLPLLCDDANVCTDDRCDPESGCSFVSNSVACDDGSACTLGTCDEGRCLSGSAPDCDDLDPCTADACDEIEGCTHEVILDCGMPEVPLLGLEGRIGLIILLASVAALTALLLGWRSKA